MLTALAPLERYCQARGRRHKKLKVWGRQLVLQARRRLPGRELVVVADSGFAALEYLAATSRCGVAVITRLRLDAALHDPAPPRLPGTNGRSRTKGKRPGILSEVLADPATIWQRVTVPGWYGEGERTVKVSTNTAVRRHGGMPVLPIRWVLVRNPLGRFEPQALLCTDPAQEPVQVLRWFAQRWQVEVTFREMRDHLRVETQRQWSDKAIARTIQSFAVSFILDDDLVWVSHTMDHDVEKPDPHRVAYSLEHFDAGRLAHRAGRDASGRAEREFNHHVIVQALVPCRHVLSKPFHPGFSQYGYVRLQARGVIH